MADQKLTQLSAIASGNISSDDLMYIVDAPGGSATGLKMTLAQLASYLIGTGTRPLGRLTLTTVTPYMTATVTGATTVYYTPAEGNVCPIWDGTNWNVNSFSELSQLTTDSTKSPAACTTNSNYDIFVWNDSGTVRATRGPAWTSDIARGTGAGTTELTRLNGILVNNVSITNGPGANLGTYVGTIRTNGSSQVDMIFGGTGAAGGESTILGIWNMYNRRFVSLVNIDNTDSWAYTSATVRIKNNNNNNKISFIVGLQGDAISATNYQVYSNTTATVYARAQVGLNSTTAKHANCFGGGTRNSSAAGRCGIPPSTLNIMAPLGFNYVAPLESTAASGAGTWYGDDGGTNLDDAIFTMTTMF